MISWLAKRAIGTRKVPGQISPEPGVMLPQLDLCGVGRQQSPNRGRRSLSQAGSLR
jgi:hypothetical protein